VNAHAEHLEHRTDDPRLHPHVDEKGRRHFIAIMLFLGILSVLAVVLNLYWMYVEKTSHIGNGRDVATYGFDLSNLSVPADTLVAMKHKYKDAKPVIFDAQHVTLADVDARNSRFGSYIRYIVNDDPVVGVVVNGEPRAYPVRFIRYHEIVNDTLGGVPIAVTYSPPTDSAVVFDRRVGDDVLELGYSGLIWNSNLVMYDRRADAADESLWSQLRFEAIAGPKVGTRLTPLQMWFGPWHQWVKAYPDTTVLDRVKEHAKWYKKDPYAGYFDKGELMFPTSPMPTGETRAPMTRLLIHRGDGEYVLQEFGHEMDTDAPIIATSRWFAWHAARLGE